MTYAPSQVAASEQPTARDLVAGDDPTDGWFGESVAAKYDTPGGANDASVVTPAVNVLAELADGGPILEFAVGTGRIAAPLAARGLDVTGIELSQARANRCLS